MRARLYARFSTDRQSETSATDQLRACAEYADARGWPVISKDTDEGISGAAIGNRPSFLRVLKLAEAGDVILVTDLLRLARSQDLAPMLSRLKFRGVRIIGIQDGFDSNSRTARMQAGMSGMQSEEYLAMVKDRTWLALESRAKSGRPTGGKAYDNPAIVREIFQRFADGESLRAIASDLNTRDVPSPGATWKRTKRRKDGRWLNSTLHELIKNERYAGRIIWNKSQWVKNPDTGMRLRRPRPREEWITTHCEPVIDEITWKRAQAKFRTHNNPGGARRYLLSGLLICGSCGCKMTVMGGSQHRYGCPSFHAGGPAACPNNRTVPRKLAEELILKPVQEDLLSMEACKAGVQDWRQALTVDAKPEPTELTTLEKLVRDGVLSAEVAAPSIAEARRKAQEARDHDPLPFRRQPTAAEWRAAVEGITEILTGEDILAARDTLRELIGDIVCRPDGDHMVAELTARQLFLATGTGRWLGSGGPLCVHLPCRGTRGWTSRPDKPR
jgi:site-specific DNA recombinase